MTCATEANSEFSSLRRVELVTEPFPHFIHASVLSLDASAAILDWLETAAVWKIVIADFYEQYEFDLFASSIPGQVKFLSDPRTLNHLRRHFESLFGVRLDRKVDVTAHKLMSGQTIRLHNDFVPGQESHRYVIQFNREWHDEDGGFLLYFNSDDVEDVHSIIRPLHNSATGFEISEKSNHAVSTVRNGERFTLVYSFYASTGTD